MKLFAQKPNSVDLRPYVEAISRVQATIEFNLDGTVLTANENFLKTVGYELDEIQGQHHRMFCEPAYTNSREYAAFWQKLGRGEFDAGQYRRVGKGGKEIWIQASYNPILDANGKVYKVVKFATDITAEKNRNAEFEGKINAVNKAQAAIEFNLDGTIITANDNFLNCLGYRLDEIKGQHHRMFCDPAYTSSGEYAVFWQKLNRGEFDSGQYRRVGKGGKEIWIQASYNPILDATGKVYKVVKFATDITAQKKAQQELEACMAEAQRALGALAEGNLTQTMEGTYQGELEKIKTSVNGALANLTQTITSVRESVDAVTNGAEEISKGNEDLSQRTSEQASALEETSASMEEMTSTVKQNADNAKQANQLAIAARDTADKGGSVTKKAVEAMGEINKSSKKIADIITVIDEIAFQTNLLALNAAVEAARAGEHGRGFAVVAAEVRNLAQRSATAAKEIKGLINESIQRVNDGSELVNQSGKTLDEIVGSVKRVTDIIAEITAASQEQASGIDQVNKAIMAMDETTQQNAALVEETTSAAQSMKEQAKELLQQVAIFNTGQAEEPQRGPAFAKRVVSQPRPKLPGKTAMPAGKRMQAKAPVAVAAGNGKGHSSSGDEFEEF
jgi:methyl-accepting chemotaxis protein